MADFFCKYKISDLSEIRVVVEDLLCGVKSAFDISEEQDFRIKLVMNELLVNCFKHAGVDVLHPVQVDAKLQDSLLSFAIFDKGEGFNPKAYNKNEYIKNENRLYQESGRGLLLASSMATMLKFNRKGNRALAKINL